MAFLFGPSGSSGSSPLVYNTITGTTRWNTTTSMMEMFDGVNWVAISAGEIRAVTLADMVESAEDQLGVIIEEKYPDNVTIQDAFKEWEAANERFRVILSIAEKNEPSRSYR